MATILARAERVGWRWGDDEVAQASHRHVALARTIETEIVPRLLLGRAPQSLAQDGALPPLLTQEVLNLATLSLGRDEEIVNFAIRDAAQRRTLEAVCLELLAPAARHLGDLWSEDLCSFAEVTIGMVRLHNGLRLLGAAARPGARVLRRHRILLAPAPGEQHFFGLAMLAVFFRQSGWAVTLLPDGGELAVRDALRRCWFGILGISLGSERNYAPVAAMLPRLRENSRNAAVSVMVGGPTLIPHPEIVGQMGADGTAADGLQAALIAENLLAAQGGHG